MKKGIMLSIFMLFGVFIYAQSAIGVWKTIDDETNQPKSHVEIYKNEKGELEGKVVKILTEGKEDATCTKCSGDLKDKPIQGLQIIRGLKEDGKDSWKGGYILDPNNGKEYKCKMTLKDDNTLDVRGFVGFSLLGRTQTWHRVQ